MCSCWGGRNRKFCKRTDLSPRVSLVFFKEEVGTAGEKGLNFSDVLDIGTSVVTSGLPPAHLCSAGSSLTRGPLKGPKETLLSVARTSRALIGSGIDYHRWRREQCWSTGAL